MGFFDRFPGQQGNQQYTGHPWGAGARGMDPRQLMGLFRGGQQGMQGMQRPMMQQFMPEGFQMPQRPGMMQGTQQPMQQGGYQMPQQQRGFFGGRR